MRSIAVLVAALVLMVVGCDGDDDAPAVPATTTTQVPATTQPAVESTTPPSSGDEAVDATVVYEPGNCTYFGPAVIPRGAKMAFEFDDSGHAVTLIVEPVIDGTTREEIIDYMETHGGPNAGPMEGPYFAVGRPRFQPGAGLMVVEFPDDGDWTVECRTPPQTTNRAYLGGMIEVIQPAAEFATSPSSGEEAVDATVVYEPGNCTYFGPAVIPRGTKATFEFGDGGHAVDFVVGLVIDGITREEIIEYSETYGGPNAGSLVTPYYSAGPFYFQEGAGLMVVEFRDDGDWTVECITPSHLTNRRYLGGMIEVVEG